MASRVRPGGATRDPSVSTIRIPASDTITSDVYASVAGRKFRAWIDADSRSNGYNSGDLIENPAYIIESIIRDEILTEKNLVITTKTSTTVLRSTSLFSTTDDYYNGAYYHNLTTGHETTISDYTGSTKEITLASADASVAVNDIVELTSIKYSDKIDYASFDVVGNTTNGKRDDWIFGRSITNTEASFDTLTQLCFEAHCMMFEDNNGKYKLIALDTDTTSTNVIDETQIVGTPSLVRTRAFFNDFNIGYSYNYATGAFEKSVVVNEKESSLTSDSFTYTDFTPDESSAITTYGASLTASLCGVSQTRYKRKNSFSGQLVWHYDTATVNLWVKKIIEWLYAPKIVLTLTGWRGNSFTTGYKPLLAYELGDQCKVSHPILDPDISDVYFFMVVGKSINPTEQSVTLTLMQMR